LTSASTFRASSPWRLENKILIKLLNKAYVNMNPEQRKEFDSKITEAARKVGDTCGKGLAGTARLMVLGNLGGFATYTLMCTVLSTVTFWGFGLGVKCLHSGIKPA
jgi:hypothetical protein